MTVCTVYMRAHTRSWVGDKAANTWHLIIWKREWEWNIWEIYLHASHLPDSLKSHAQSSALLSAQRITQTVCMNNERTLNPRCAEGKKERKIKREEENWSRCRGQTTETRGAWTELNYNLRDPGLILKGWRQRFRQTCTISCQISVPGSVCGWEVIVCLHMRNSKAAWLF